MKRFVCSCICGEQINTTEFDEYQAFLVQHNNPNSFNRHRAVTVAGAADPTWIEDSPYVARRVADRQSKN